ncbi:glycosyl hydrolase, family 38 [Vibrio ishigakensis]|uniref:Glycosyl hydrolase, family 38 n=2 Tax=Vibrio ishigakensis TaxID=1481914 RepID=A0A0B8P3E1_9VIBR|nr:glycosyl hydrolase, family 38 [Vibrio ishigakensis]
MLSSIGHSFIKDNAVIVRLFNATDQEQILDITQFAQFGEVERVNYREHTLAQEWAVKANNSIDIRVTFKV